MPTILHYSQCQQSVLRCWQGLSLLSPLWWAQAPTNGQNYTKKPDFFVFCNLKPPFRKLIELWWPLPREHLLCDIIRICHSQAPGVYFARNTGFNIPSPIPQNHFFIHFLVWMKTLRSSSTQEYNFLLNQTFEETNGIFQLPSAKHNQQTNVWVYCCHSNRTSMWIVTEKVPSCQK